MGFIIELFIVLSSWSSLLFYSLAFWQFVSFWLIFWLPTHKLYLGHGLRCQTCSGGDYKCEGENDNGQSVECPAWSTSCVYAKYYGAYEGGNFK